MSYCRWSSDDFGCDLYCYQSRRGYETNVASNRVIGDIPKTGPFPVTDPEAWAGFWIRHRAQLDWLGSAQRQPIGLPFDGESFTDPDLDSFLERLKDLRSAGYRFPDHVLDDVRAEIEAGSAA